MGRRLNHFIKNKWRKASSREIDPDEIFLDSSNLPQFDTHQFEGRIEKPISKNSLIFLGVCFMVLGGVYASKVWVLQVKEGKAFSERSENNRLRHTPIFSQRGVIFDRNNKELVWNVPGTDEHFTLRKYTELPGFAHLLGYVKYPSKDKYGFYYREDFVGMDGIEKHFNSELQGTNGIRIVEVDALQKMQSESVMKPPKEGTNLTLSIDADLQNKMYQVIHDVANRVGFAGGAGIIMNIHNGEVLAMTSYPEYSSQVLSDGNETSLINEYLNDDEKPFLDRVIDGLYTPGSIVKPFVAIGALNEKIISPTKEILSTGSISVQNQYYPELKTVFKDWKAHGYTDMRRALAVSSDVYFYTVGGGYEDQKGMGIANIDKYAQMFGLGETVKDSFFTGSEGVIPTPEWKSATFNGEEWSLGNTYHTAIGQYGFQVTPLQMVRAVAALANNGTLVNPSILKDNQDHVITGRKINLPQEYFKVIQEGMRLAVTEGTGMALKKPYVEVAAKSGTAELGVSKDKVNSWMIGYFPYENPKYAFAVTMEKGDVHNLVGAGVVMGEVLDWMNVYTPQYLKADL